MAATPDSSGDQLHEEAPLTRGFFFALTLDVSLSNHERRTFYDQ
jgi:hypothetical protein